MATAPTAGPAPSLEDMQLHQVGPADLEVICRLGQRTGADATLFQYDGGNGIVMKVRHRRTGQKLALKIMLNYEDVSYAKFRARFEREYRIPEAIGEHPCIIRIYCHFPAQLSELGFTEFDPAIVQQRTVCILMELGKRTLKQYLREKGALPLLEICSILESLLRAVLYIQSKHVAHCDLKADNVILTRDKRWVLIDFGTGKDFNRLHQTLKALGVPNIAPFDCLMQDVC